ncbi:unnamed protein product, partial [Pocillopora meandrina]
YGGVKILQPEETWNGRKNLKKGALQNHLRLSLKLKLANPWIGEFMVDMPMEVMDCITEFVLNQNSFGHKFSETNNQLSYRI